MRVAVIGAGTSGLLAARQLAAVHDVHVFEAGSHIGGHANALEIDLNGARHRVDVGFLVFNQMTCPSLSRLLGELQVPIENVDSSFAVQCIQTGLDYRGGTMRDLIAVRRNLIHPSYYGFLRDLVRFGRIVEKPGVPTRFRLDNVTLEELIEREGLGRAFVEGYLIPLATAVWPLPVGRLLKLPASCLIAFLNNHGLSPRSRGSGCQTISGGSRAFIDQLSAPLEGRIHVNTPVASVARTPDHVILKIHGRPRERFDQVIMATHADTALKLLADPTRPERNALGTFEYEPHEVVLHTDSDIVPGPSSPSTTWFFCSSGDEQNKVMLTYNLTQLQKLDTPHPIYLTWHDHGRVREEHILGRIRCRRPTYTRQSLEAHRYFDQLNGKRRTYYCGAYWGNGLHEDAVRSAVEAVQLFHVRAEGAPLPTPVDMAEVPLLPQPANVGLSTGEPVA